MFADSHAAWFLTDSKTGLLRSQTAAQLFEGPYGTEMVEYSSEEGPGGTITPSTFSRGHA